MAAFLAVVFTQIGFLGHDAGHRQVFSTRRASYVTGILLGNLGIGLSYCWWVDKHNRHHAHRNTEDADPDIAVGALAFSSAQAGASRGLARLVFRYQAYLFFPLLLGEAVNLHVASVRALTRRAARRRSWEGALITVHAAGYLTAVFLVLSPVKAVVFIIVQQGLFGLYLGSSFAPNHKGMPILDAADRSDFLRRQALTSRNVRGGWLDGLRARRPELPDRAPPVPLHAAAQPAPLAGPGQGVLSAARGCRTVRAAWRAPTPRPCATSTPSAGQPAQAPRPRRQPGLKRSGAAKSSRETAVARPGESGRRRAFAGCPTPVSSGRLRVVVP